MIAQPTLIGQKTSGGKRGIGKADRKELMDRLDTLSPCQS